MEYILENLRLGTPAHWTLSRQQRVRAVVCCEELPDDLGRVQPVDGGSVCRSFWASTLGVAPGHWWPAPAMVTSSTVRPSGQLAAEVVTTPAVLITGAAQWPVPRQEALRAGMAGPSMCARPSPRPPL